MTLSFLSSLPLWKRGMKGDFTNNFFKKSPLTPLCQRGGYRLNYHYKNIILMPRLAGGELQPHPFREAINFPVSVNITIPLNPKRSSPMLPARGTPSSTAPTAHAILKRIKTLPPIRPLQESQFRVYFFDSSYRAYAMAPVKTPSTYQVRSIISLPPSSRIS